MPFLKLSQIDIIYSIRQLLMPPSRDHPVEITFLLAKYCEIRGKCLHEVVEHFSFSME